MGVGGLEIIDTMKESVSGPQNDQMFSKNLGHGSPHQGPTSLSSLSLLLKVSTRNEIGEYQPMTDAATWSTSLSH